MRHAERLVSISLGLLAAALALSHPAGASPARCSMIGFAGPVGDRTVFFLGVARPDTVLAGPGRTVQVAGPGHFGPESGRPVYGQLVAVERFGGPGAQLDARHDSLVVVIPWDYDPQCRPMRWTRSDQFVEPGVQKFFLPVLRDREAWVGGLPTFDAFVPEWSSFPNPARDSTRRGQFRVMTAVELFDLYQRVPSHAAIAREDWAVVTPLLEWSEERWPGLEVYPGRQLVEFVSGAANRELMRGIEPAVAGTYRMTLTLPSGATETFYLRTSATASSNWWPPPADTATWAATPTWRRRATGYELHFWHAPTPDALPSDSASAHRDRRGEWPLMVRHPPDSANGTRSSLIRLVVDQLTRSVPGHAEVAALVRQYWANRRDAQGRLTDTGESGRFVESGDGSMRLEIRFTVSPTVTLDLVGERISRVVLPRPW